MRIIVPSVVAAQLTSSHRSTSRDAIGWKMEVTYSDKPQPGRDGRTSGA